MIMIAMLLSGAVAGLVGMPQLLGSSYSYSLDFPTGLGFTGIAIALPEGADLGGVVATASSLAMGALLDALTEVMRQARGTRWEDLLHLHPAGIVGKEAGATLGRLGSDDA